MEKIDLNHPHNIGRKSLITIWVRNSAFMEYLYYKENLRAYDFLNNVLVNGYYDHVDAVTLNEIRTSWINFK